MSESTVNLQLPFLAAEQAQKHVILNETLLALDCLVQLCVASRSLAVPPSMPQDGERYLLAQNAQGAWSGHGEKIAVWQDGGWRFHAPMTGWVMWVEDEAQLIVRTADGWQSISAVDEVGQLGIGATADADNRLAISSPAALFNHAGSDHRLKINKAAAGATASLVMQNGFSGRAELGLAGDDNFRIKVSPDGTTWRDALVLEAATGRARFPAGLSGLLGAQVTVDFGLVGAQSQSFDLILEDARPGQRVIASVHLADDVAADELEMDMIAAAAAVTGPGRIRLIAASLSGPVTGLRTFNLILMQ
jgi:hypothetical protein